MSTADVSPPDLSVVIVNYNTHELVRDCLESLRAEAERGVRLEAIVVDNASPRAGIVDVCAALTAPFAAAGARLEFVAAERNLGFTGGNNLGLARATGTALLLLNSDTVVHPGALAACIDYLRAQPEVGILGPRLLNADGSHQMSCRRFPTFRTALFNRYSLLTRLFPGNPWSRRYLMNDAATATEPMPVDWVSGAALFVTRRCLEAIGPLDERFFMYAEDVDWCKRAHDAGFEVVYLPAARITHLIGQSSRRVPLRTIYWRHRSMWVYYDKHYSRRVALFDLLTLLGIAGRAALKIAQTALLRALRRPPPES